MKKIDINRVFIQNVSWQTNLNRISNMTKNLIRQLHTRSYHENNISVCNTNCIQKKMKEVVPHLHKDEDWLHMVEVKFWQRKKTCSLCFLEIDIEQYTNTDSSKRLHVHCIWDSLMSANNFGIFVWFTLCGTFHHLQIWSLLLEVSGEQLL